MACAEPYMREMVYLLAAYGAAYLKRIARKRWMLTADRRRQ